MVIEDNLLVCNKEKEIVATFLEAEKNKTTLQEFIDSIDKIEEWKFGKNAYCVSPAPFQREKDGFVTGSLLKKKFVSLEEANKNKCYSFGFVNDQIKVIVSPFGGKFDRMTFCYFEHTPDSICMECNCAEYDS